MEYNETQQSEDTKKQTEHVSKNPKKPKQPPKNGPAMRTRLQARFPRVQQLTTSKPSYSKQSPDSKSDPSGRLNDIGEVNDRDNNPVIAPSVESEGIVTAGEDGPIGDADDQPDQHPHTSRSPMADYMSPSEEEEEEEEDQEEEDSRWKPQSQSTPPRELLATPRSPPAVFESEGTICQRTKELLARALTNIERLEVAQRGRERDEKRIREKEDVDSEEDKAVKNLAYQLGKRRELLYNNADLRKKLNETNSMIVQSRRESIKQDERIEQLEDRLEKYELG